MTICKLDNHNYCIRHRRIHIGRELDVSQMDNELGEKYREIWDKELEPGFKPLITTMQFGRAIYEHMMAGMPKVDDQKYAERLSICDVCEHCDKSDDRWMCKLCSCYLKEGKLLPGKARWATQECPIGKWMALPMVEHTLSSKPGCCGG